MSHTPGPWNVWKKNDGTLAVANNHAHTETPFDVCTVDGDNPCDDARLIAAAPDMLDALSTARVALKLRLRKDDVTDSELSVLLLIDDAIAKAKGENRNGSLSSQSRASREPL